jgi:uncharacterized protein YndB with AHSA1/START domain
MNDTICNAFDPELDLSFERIVDVPPERVWEAWTKADLVKQWLCPRPWQTVVCEIDLRPGGKFNTVMRSPEGKEFPGRGCYLEILPNNRLVWTNALLPGFRPAPTTETEDICCSFAFTGIVSLSPHVDGTRYSAVILHADKAARERHASMGFEEGWGKALDQMIAMIKAG